MITIDIQRRPYSRNWSGNPIPYRLFVDSNDPDLYFDVRIHFRRVGAAIWDELPSLPFYPVEGAADIDLSAMLETQLSYEMPALEDGTAVQRVPNHSGEFYISYRWVLPDDVGPWVEDELAFVRRVYKGGLDYQSYRGNNYWINYFDQVKPFLTWQERGRLASMKERMYLAYLINDDLGANTRRPRARIYYTDGTFETLYADFINGVRGEIFYIPAGAAQWDIERVTPAGKTIHYWEVAIVKKVLAVYQVITESFRYYLDNKNSYNELYINFRNSLGGLDSVAIRGEIREGVEYSAEEVESVVAPDYFSGPTIQRVRSATNSREVLQVKGDIGYMGKEAQDRMRDMNVNRELWQEKRLKWIPLMLTTKSFELRTTASKRWSMPIEFQMPENRYYTPASVDLGDGQFTDNVSAASVFCNSHVVALTSTEMTATLGLIEVDPANDSTMFQYRIEEYLGAEILPWTVQATGPVTFTAPKDKIYLLQVQCISGPYLGRLCQFYVDGRIDTPAGGGSVIVNNSGAARDVTLRFKRTPAPLVFTIAAHSEVRFNAGSQYGTGVDLEMTNPPASAADVQLLIGGFNFSMMGTLSGNHYSIPEFFSVVDNLQITIS